MESFDKIYLDLSKENGKCRFSEAGLGWKPAGGGEAVTLEAGNIAAAHWSRASKGYEVKILLRSSDVIQLDGFLEEVWTFLFYATPVGALLTNVTGPRASDPHLQKLVQSRPRDQGPLAARMELGEGRIYQSRAHLQRSEPTLIRDTLLRDHEHQSGRTKRDRRRVCLPGW